MTARVISPPALEPLSLADARAHVRVDDTAEDALIARLVSAARERIERLSGLALITQRWLVSLDCWPSGAVLELPVSPVASIDVVRTFDDAGSATVADTSTLVLDGWARPARVLRTLPQWPAPGRLVQAIEIELTAGFGPTPGDCPADLVQAVAVLAAHWFENREVGDVPDAVETLIRPHATVRL